MTSKLTRERLEKIKSWRETYGAGSNVMLPAEEAEELARIALAAMDSESGCLPLDYLQGHKDGLDWAARLAEASHHETGDWLYDDPIELTKAIRKGPDMQPVQPAPVVPDEMTPEQAYEIGDYHGDPVDVFARGANWMRQHIIDSTLAAAPQSPGSEPATVPGKWIPVSERMPLTPSADCEYSDIEVNVFDGERVFTAHYATGSQPQPWGGWVDTYAKITHWQPLPSAPQEDKP